MIKKSISLLTLLLVVQLLAAQAPAGYYNATKGASGRNLKTAFFKVIADHRDIGYDKLWSAFQKTDRRPDGKVWDMYSNTTNYTFGRDQDHGNHSAEGDTYNREHSFPKSWFGDKRPMHNDLFHLYPTDSYVNGVRSNYPFGETDRPSKTSHNGWSKFGSSSVPGYSGKVFEPNDEYKGDFARSYFYMATAYENKIGSWSSPMLSHNSYPAYTKWAIDMLLRWAKNDPVSEKEINRNNEVYKIQGNRNPYIDFPGLEQYVWGDKTDVAFDPNNYEQGGGGVDPNPNPEPNPDPDEKEVAAPTFSVPAGTVEAHTPVVISTTTAGATLHYSINGGSYLSEAGPVTYTIDEDVVLKAYAQLGDKKSATVEAAYSVVSEPVVGNGVFVKVNSTADLEIGHRYLIVCEEKNVALGERASDVRGFASVSISNQTIKSEVSAEGYPYALVLGGNAQGYTLYDAASRTYLALTTSGNKLNSIDNCNGTDGRWKISFSAEIANIVSVKYSDRSIQYNANSPRFATYKSKQKPVALYKEAVADAIEYPVVLEGTVDVYAIDGRLIRDDVKQENALKGLPRGIYVVGGLKVMVR